MVRMVGFRFWLALAVALLGCSSKSDPPASTAAKSNEGGSGSAAPAQPQGSAQQAPQQPQMATKAADKKLEAKAPSKKAAPTKAQLAEFKKHKSAGWAAQKAKKWAEAVTEFEAALAVIPGDQVALAELGWSAQNAGDFAKAKKADENAIKVAVDRKLKAQGLFNLGQVQEKSGDKDAAAKSYKLSLSLRKNAVVQAALDKLGKSPAAEPVFCAAGKSPCDCAIEHAFGNDKEGATCSETKTTLPVAGFKTFHINREGPSEEWDYLLDEHSQLVAVVGGTYDHGKHFETTQLDRTEVKSIAGKPVLWVERTTKASTATPSGDDGQITDEDELTLVTLCVIGTGKDATRCPLRDVPLHHVAEHDEMKSADDKGTHAREESKLELTIGDDGVANVKAVKGPSDASIAGPHKLW